MSGLMAKRTVQVDGITVEYSLVGDRGPVVVLLNGFRMPMSSWERLYPRIQSCGRVLAYNRCGVGGTDKAGAAQDGDAVIGLLLGLLKTLGLAPPYVLAAHSLGGIFANLFARLKPRDTAAVVFVEAAHPDEKELQARFKPPLPLRLVNGALRACETVLDRYRYSEDECLAETVRQIAAAGDFPLVPLTVISGGKKMPLVPRASFDLHLRCQEKLAALTPDALRVMAAQSGHFPQFTEAELVADAIGGAVREAGLGG